MSTPRRRRLFIGPVMALSMLGSLIPATAVLATGSCPGPKDEIVFPAEQQMVDPRAAYDRNGDGIICLSVTSRFKKVQYSDNKR